MNNYHLSHNNKTNFYRDKNEGNAECKIKLFIHTKGDSNQFEKCAENNNILVPRKKSFESLEEISWEKFCAIKIHDFLKGSNLKVEFNGEKSTNIRFGSEIDSNLKEMKLDKKPKVPRMKKSQSVYDIEEIPHALSPVSNPSLKRITFERHLVFQELVSTMLSSDQRYYKDRDSEIKIYVTPDFEYTLELRKDNEVLFEILMKYLYLLEYRTDILSACKCIHTDSSGSKREVTIIFDTETRCDTFMNLVLRIKNVEENNCSNLLILNSNIFRFEKIETVGEKIITSSQNLEKFWWLEIIDNERATVLSVYSQDHNDQLKVEIKEDLIHLDENVLTYNIYRFTFIRNIYAQIVYDQLIKMGIVDTECYFSCFCRMLFQDEKTYGKLLIEKYENNSVIIFKTSNTNIICKKNYKKSHFRNRKNSQNIIRYLNCEFEFLSTKDKKSFISALNVIEADEFCREAKSFMENINKKITNKFNKK